MKRPLPDPTRTATLDDWIEMVEYFCNDIEMLLPDCERAVQEPPIDNAEWRAIAEETVSAMRALLPELHRMRAVSERVRAFLMAYLGD